MKVIELLNKIANGKASDLRTYFTFGEEKYNFYQFANAYAIDINSLNWEVEVVEVIEEDKKIENNFQYVYGCDDDRIKANFENIKTTLENIIKVINEMREDK